MLSRVVISAHGPSICVYFTSEPRAAQAAYGKRYELRIWLVGLQGLPLAQWYCEKAQ